jgi:hypothetical protein
VWPSPKIFHLCHIPRLRPVGFRKEKADLPKGTRMSSRARRAVCLGTSVASAPITKRNMPDEHHWRVVQGRTCIVIATLMLRCNCQASRIPHKHDPLRSGDSAKGTWCFTTCEQYPTVKGAHRTPQYRLQTPVSSPPLFCRKALVSVSRLSTCRSRARYLSYQEGT